MDINSRPFSFVFVMAFVSLYSSMTCLRSNIKNINPIVQNFSNKASAQVFTTKTSGETTALANIVSETHNTPKEAQEKNSIQKKINSRVNQTNSTLFPFLKKLREFRLSWANFPIKRPAFIKGIYLTNATAISTKSLKHFVDRSRKYGLNTLVIDTQGKMLTREQISYIKSNGIYPIARVVCFDLGLKEEYPNKAHLDGIMQDVENAAKAGFQEVQLDYIRYADEPKLLRLPLKFKYEQINHVLSRARRLTDSLGVELGADVFGRITLNEHDQIGQRLEIFGDHVHNLYPMVYPSHYYGDPEKIADPYGTVKEGVENSKERIPKTRIIPWIQGFAMKIKESGLSLPEYILKQLYAVDDAKGDGYVVWNARNDYTSTWKAIKEYDRLVETRKKTQPHSKLYRSSG